MSQEMLQVLQSSVPLGYKLKKLNQVAKQLSEAEVDNIIKQLKLNPNLDDILVRVIDKFQRLPEAVYILQHGTRTSIQYAVKLRWLYVTPGSPLTSPEYLIEQLFPRIAFTTRQKVINKLGNHLRDGQIADEIFRAVQAKYGFSMAFPMFQACSEDFVSSTLNSSKITLPVPQSLVILQRYPKVGIEYIKKHLYLSIHLNYLADHHPQELLQLKKDHPKEFDLEWGLRRSIWHRYLSIHLNYLADHHPQELLQLKKDHPKEFDLEWGLRRSKRFLKSYTTDFVKLARTDQIRFKGSQLLKHLSQQQLVQVIGKYSRSGFLERCESIFDWNYVYDSHKSRRQLEIFQSLYKTAFNKSLLYPPGNVSATVISMLENPEIRERLINWKIKYGTTDQRFRISRHSKFRPFSNPKWFWMTFKPTSVSIPEFTKILDAKTDCGNRGELYRAMILTCIVNNDSVQLLKMFRLLSQKSWNEMANVRELLLIGMYDASSVMEFHQDHWTCFDEVLRVCQFYKDNSYIDYANRLRHKQVAYLLHNNLPINRILTLIVTTCGSYWDSSPDFNLSNVKGAENQRKLIESYVAVLESVSAAETGRQELRSPLLALAQVIDKWNQINRNVNKINISSYPWLDSRYKELFNYPEMWNQVRENRELFRVLVKDDNFQEHFLDDNLQGIIHHSVLNFAYLTWRKYPTKIRENLEHIVKTALKVDNIIIRKRVKKREKFCPFWRLIGQVKRAGGNEKMIEKIRDECNSVLQNPSQIQYSKNPFKIQYKKPAKIEKMNQNSKNEVIVTNAIKILAVINEPEDFLTFAQRNHPEEMKLDPKNINEMDYAIKKAIAESLKYLKNPRLAIKSVEKFCGGDYLKFVLGSLYSVCNALPEHEALLFLRTQLKEKPAVSVRKHMIRLFFSIAPLQEKPALLRELFVVANHPTTRFEILAQLYNLLKDNSEKGVWENFQVAVESLTDEDSPSLEYLKSCCLDDNLHEFTSDFFKLVLHTFDRVGAEEDYKFQIYSRMLDIFSKLKDDFLDELVPVAFKTALESISKDCQVIIDFVVKYLVNDHISQQIQWERLKIIIPIVQDMYVNHWDKQVMTSGSSTSQIFVTKRLLKLFFQNLCYNVLFCKNEALDKKKIIEEFLLQLQTIPEFSRTFTNIFTLQVTSLILDNRNFSKNVSDNEQCKNIGKGVAALIDSYLTVHGPEFLLVTRLVLPSVLEFLRQHLHGFNDSWLIHGILIAGKTKSNILTALTEREEEGIINTFAKSEEFIVLNF